MLPASFFTQYRQAILELPLKGSGEKYSRRELINPRFLLFQEAGLDVYYAPFHCSNPDACVALIGLTPGWTQMEEAFRAARLGLSRDWDGCRLFNFIDSTASFSGSMRKNLVSMLDRIGLANVMELRSSSELFDGSSRLVHFTSIVSAPIFKRGGNYRGYGPRLLRVAGFRQWIIRNLACELASTAEALLIPLGRVADEAIRFLSSQSPGQFDGRYLAGFPHPSGANGHRKRDFERGRAQWARQIAEWFDQPFRVPFSNESIPVDLP